jgi:hypothetical protein
MVYLLHCGNEAFRNNPRDDAQTVFGGAVSTSLVDCDQTAPPGAVCFLIT